MIIFSPYGNHPLKADPCSPMMNLGCYSRFGSKQVSKPSFLSDQKFMRLKHAMRVLLHVSLPT